MLKLCGIEGNEKTCLLVWTTVWTTNQRKCWNWDPTLRTTSNHVHSPVWACHYESNGWHTHFLEHTFAVLITITCTGYPNPHRLRPSHDHSRFRSIRGSAMGWIGRLYINEGWTIKRRRIIGFFQQYFYALVDQFSDCFNLKFNLGESHPVT